jgi:hypothetical protein
MIPGLIRQLEEAAHIAADAEVSEKLIRKLKNYGLDKKPARLDKGEIGSGANFVEMVKTSEVPYLVVDDTGDELLIVDHKLAKSIKTIAETNEIISFDRYHVYFVTGISSDTPSIEMVPKFKLKDRLEEKKCDLDAARHIYRFEYVPATSPALDSSATTKTSK